MCVNFSDLNLFQMHLGCLYACIFTEYVQAGAYFAAWVFPHSSNQQHYVTKLIYLNYLTLAMFFNQQLQLCLRKHSFELVVLVLVDYKSR